MLPQWIIEKKRDGKPLADEEIHFFINGYSAGDIPDYQMSALAMAIYLKGMSREETAALTDAMMNSGQTMDTSSIRLPKVDKHSTGGIGDKVSLLWAPLLACCNVAVPMLSGRGLGITGGTLDKLDSIPGYRTDLTSKEWIKVLETCGCSITGPTEQLVPADKKLYALRDVTGTVPSIPLIVASIMSKKLAEGIDALVLDVKWGKGAFMKTREQAQKLAQSLVEVGKRMDKQVAAIITDMNQPLGRSVGNALEVKEVMETLTGRGPDDLMEVTLALGARMLILIGHAQGQREARDILTRHLQSGAALRKFMDMVELHGGDIRVLRDLDTWPSTAIRKKIVSSISGKISEVDAEKIGKACMVLGAGRVRTDDRIDSAVGISNLSKIGDPIEKGQPLATIHANDPEKLEEALPFMKQAFGVAGKTQPISVMVTDP